MTTLYSTRRRRGFGGLVLAGSNDCSGRAECEVPKTGWINATYGRRTPTFIHCVWSILHKVKTERAGREGEWQGRNKKRAKKKRDLRRPSAPDKPNAPQNLGGRIRTNVPRPTAHGVVGSVELDGDDGSCQDWLEMEKLRSPPTPWPLPENGFSPTSTAEADSVTPSRQGPQSSPDSHHPLSFPFFLCFC